MKRLAHASKDELTIEDVVPKHNPLKIGYIGKENDERCNNLQNLIYNSDPDFFDTFCTFIGVSGNKLTICYPYNKSNDKKITISIGRLSEDAVLRKVERAKEDILDYYTDKLELKNMRKLGLRVYSAQAVLHRLAKKYKGISPWISYSDSHLSAWNSGDILALMEVMDIMSEEYPDIHISGPHSEYRLGQCTRTYGPNYLYDSNTDTYTME